jgi:hypothetical protein
MWNPRIVAKFAVLSQYLYGATEKYHEKLQDSRCPGQNSNPRPPEYKLGLLLLTARLVYVGSFHLLANPICKIELKLKKTKLRGLSPQANYTD